MKPSQLLKRYEPRQEAIKRQQDDSERDPTYDHDHSLAHGASKQRTLSVGQFLTLPLKESSAGPVSPIIEEAEKHRRRRRASHGIRNMILRTIPYEVDVKETFPKQLLLNVEDTQRRILTQEDTDGDFQITVSDAGPKMLPVGTYRSHGLRTHEIRGTYALANLLQELALASDHGRNTIVLDEERLHENPVDRLSRMIKYHFWDGLTRRIDADGLEAICLDPKNRSVNQTPRIYVPFEDQMALDYFSQVRRDKPGLNLEVVRLPKDITPQYVKSINHLPGILSLGLQKTVRDGKEVVRGVPFVVPGGRFNEMYGWDSYFETLGLLIDGRIGLSRAMVDNFVYEIQHYGKILNANRSYYLTRSQPPFLTDMALQVYSKLAIEKEDENKQWLAQAFRAAIKEYYKVWMSAPRYVPEVGLSRFHAEGIGMPPETEASHFDAVLTPFASKHGVDIPTFARMYNEGTVKEPELDEYFIHDRAVRESGHDTTYRLEGKCADICPIDLNSLLYKYEVDIGNTIKIYFNDAFVSYDGSTESSAIWFQRAERRKELINKFCWNEERGLYFDYDIKLKQQNPYESATSYFALWAGVASKEQAAALVLFEVQGGLVSGTEVSRGEINLSRPNRQWDYPFGWAPHQMVAWRGLSLYGHIDFARRLAYRWLYTITKSFVDFNGVVPEKFDVVTLNHRVKVEYGNVGVDFKFIPREGFGWMNSSFKVGLTYMTSHMRRALGALVHPDKFFERAIPAKERRSV